MFVKGKSGNPKGYSASHKLAHLVRLHTEPIKLIAEMNNIAMNPEGKFDTRDQLQAIKELLDRGYGKPPQTVTVEKPVEVDCFDTGKLSPDELDKLEGLLVLAGAMVPEASEPDDAEDQ